MSKERFLTVYLAPFFVPAVILLSGVFFAVGFTFSGFCFLLVALGLSTQMGWVTSKYTKTAYDLQEQMKSGLFGGQMDEIITSLGFGDLTKSLESDAEEERNG